MLSDADVGDPLWEALSARVTHITALEAEAGVEHIMEQLAAHLDAIDRSDYCPSCRWHPVRTYKRCAEWRALWNAWRDLDSQGQPHWGAMDGHDPARETARAAMRQHEQSCPTCTTVVRETSQFEGCAALSQLHDLLTVHTDRLTYLAATETLRQASQHTGQQAGQAEEPQP